MEAGCRDTQIARQRNLSLLEAAASPQQRDWEENTPAEGTREPGQTVLWVCPADSSLLSNVLCLPPSLNGMAFLRSLPSPDRRGFQEALLARVPHQPSRNRKGPPELPAQPVELAAPSPRWSFCPDPRAATRVVVEPVSHLTVGPWRPLTEAALPDLPACLRSSWDRGQAVRPPGSKPSKGRRGRGRQQRGALEPQETGLAPAERRALTEGAADRAIGGHSRSSVGSPSPGGQGGKGCHRSRHKIHLSRDGFYGSVS